MFNHTCTIYNKYQDSGTDKWHRTVLSGVFWKDIKGTVIQKQGTGNQSSLRLIIPKSISNAADYVEPDNYSGSGWTLKAGDIVVFGEVTDTITVSAAKELAKYSTMRIILAVDNYGFASDMANWEVTGK